MAGIFPFRGILYNPEKITNISDVVTPPYDVISDTQRDAYYDRHKNNVIRLDKGRPADTDTADDNPCTRAAAYFQDWLKQAVLRQDAYPALYLTAVSFFINDQPVTRFGLIANVKLESFDKGIVLPHETTFSKVKTERLDLIKTCHANFSQIFSIFSDPTDILGILKNSVRNTVPVFDFKDDDGHRHRLWRITDPDLHQRMTEAFFDKKLFIADGHHRYETALNYRKWLTETRGELPEDHPAHFIMMYLCSVQDPGLVILPTHRMLTTVSNNLKKQFFKKADACFKIEKKPLNPTDPDSIRKQLHAAMAAQSNEHKFGMFAKGETEFYILTLKPGTMDQIFGNEIAAPLKELDVIVLTRLIFVKLLGFTDDMLDDHDLIHFTSKVTDAVSAATTGSHDMVFILNPTTNEQVTRIAEAGLMMPRKSTYYYPKAISGQVMRSLDPAQ